MPTPMVVHPTTQSSRQQQHDTHLECAVEEVLGDALEVGGDLGREKVLCVTQRRQILRVVLKEGLELVRVEHFGLDLGRSRV